MGGSSVHNVGGRAIGAGDGAKGSWVTLLMVPMSVDGI